MDEANMNEVQKAIEGITYFDRIFPKEAFWTIAGHKEEAVPYLREAVEYAISKKRDIEEDYQLHFYALYLLGEFQDRDSFPMIMRLASLPEEDLDCLIGDCITENLRDILYNTYNGDMELLKKTIQNTEVSEFARAAMLDVMAQLYLDGILTEQEWKEFLRNLVHDGREYDYLYDATADVLCRCHFADMLPEIRYMLDEELMDEMFIGKYDSCLDLMFEYREDDNIFCKTPINAADTLRRWAMFEDDPDEPKLKKKDYMKELLALEKELGVADKKKKIGRNDLCYCGSGRKYKFCCINKPQDVIDSIESPEERSKWLKRYPDIGTEKIEGRIYLTDYFDASGIEIDQILYLALMHRYGLIWKRNAAADKKRTREYLQLAFKKFVEKMEEENIASLKEYDEKYSIHYCCEEWLSELCELLHENNELGMYNEVRKFVAEKLNNQ